MSPSSPDDRDLSPDQPGPVPQDPSSSAGADRPTGPVPQDPSHPGSPPPVGGSSPGGPPPTGHPSASVADSSSESEDDAVSHAEAVIEEDLASLSRERDELRSLAQRLQADFENYKKRVVKQQDEVVARAAERLVEKLLPALDTVDLAVAHGGGEAVEQVWSALFDVLSKEGLERLDPQGQPFDPNEHDAVMHEPGDGAPEVVEVMRAGYRWKGRVLRPAMVKVKGS